jgi:hypothetical protein
MTTKKKAPSATRSRRARRHPEFELPPLIVQTIMGYLGPRVAGRLTTDQAAIIQSYASRFAVDLSRDLTETAPGYEDPVEPQAARDVISRIG